MIGGLLRQVAIGAAGNVGEIQNAFEKSRQGGGKGPIVRDAGAIRQNN